MKNFQSVTKIYIIDIHTAVFHDTNFVTCNQRSPNYNLTFFTRLGYTKGQLKTGKRKTFFYLLGEIGCR